MRGSLSIRSTGLVLLAGLLASVPDARPGESLAPAAGRFLVAHPGMGDPRFRHAVILLIRYGAEGAVGLIVNRSTDLTLAEAFPGLTAMQGLEQRLWLGGPVELERPALLVDAPEPPAESLTVMGSIHFSRSMEALETLASSGTGRFRVYAGYAGWAPGQLEGELARDAWTVAPASVEEVFSDDEDGVWQRLDAARAGTWVRRPPVTPRFVRARAPLAVLTRSPAWRPGPPSTERGPPLAAAVAASP